MKNYKKTNELLPLKIQLFAEGGNGSGNGNEKTFTENEVVEREKKLKARIDELSKIEKEYKQYKDSQLTEEEKRAKELQDRDNLIEQYRNQIENSELKEELLKDGTFTIEEANKIIQAKGNKGELAKILNSIVATKLVEAKKQWEQSLSDNSRGVGGGTGNGKDSVAVQKAKSFNKKTEDKVQWGNFQK